jgi:predicted transcriptional regulator
MRRNPTATVTFRPSDEVAKMLARLAKLKGKGLHANRSWAINRALASALPAVLEKIGA